MEPDTCGEDPLSTTASPPNLIAGLKAFTVMMLSAMSTTEELMYWIEEDPATTRFWDIKSEPVITWLAWNVFEPVVAYPKAVIWADPDTIPLGVLDSPV
jgi:hypothetical protein